MRLVTLRSRSHSGVRTTADPASVMPLVRREMAGIAVYDITTIEAKAEQSVVNERLIAALSTTLAAMATLLLSLVSFCGVMASIYGRV
jgi:hypothetical protein